MYGPTPSNTVNNTEYANRFFVYEVVGLKQNEVTDQIESPIRKSGSVYITVPYNRMNQEMQRITRMGGKIVSIKPLNDNHHSDQAGAVGQQNKKAAMTDSKAKSKSKGKSDVPVNIYKPKNPLIGKCVENRE
ncbi:MAG: phycobilisome linker polypeptide, partial [Halothece sp. Uz-M2-17]|nr:phycobilisome linker polypeptide [Halothece sp. Uz-M2-17]